MFKSLILFSLLLSGAVQANNSVVSNEQCVRVYRDNAVDLKEATDDFNDGYFDNLDFGFKVTQISTIVSARRLACLKLEDPEVKDCVKRYKKIYKSLRNKISVPSVIIGNQTEIETDFSFDVRLSYADLRCGF